MSISASNLNYCAWGACGMSQHRTRSSAVRRQTPDDTTGADSSAQSTPVMTKAGKQYQVRKERCSVQVLKTLAYDQRCQTRCLVTRVDSFGETTVPISLFCPDQRYRAETGSSSHTLRPKTLPHCHTATLPHTLPRDERL